MRIDITDASPHQLVPLDKKQRLGICGDRRLSQVFEQGQHLDPVAQIAAGQLAYHERMGKYPATL